MVAQKGNFLNVITVKSGKRDVWIVDFGASDHMTGDASLFRYYVFYYENYTVKIADGTLNKVARTCSIVISKNFNLEISFISSKFKLQSVVQQ